MRSRLLILLLAAESCAAPLAAPASLQASTMLVDWDDIPAERCNPPVHGMYLSYEGGFDLLEKDDAAARACEHRVLTAETGRKLAENRCPTCERAQQWATAGKLLTIGATVLTIGIGVIVIDDHVRR